MIEDANAVVTPWYRDHWPWLIMSMPALSAMLGAAMLVLALRSNDGLVVEDYYKQGMEINEVLDKEAHALQLGLSAEMRVDDGRVRVHLVGGQGVAGALVLRAAHPTRAGQDKVLRLRMVGADTYEAPWDELSEGRWHIVLEDEAGTWRIRGSWQRGPSVLTAVAGSQP